MSTSPQYTHLAHLGPRTLPFHKMQGSGNDFVVIDNRTARVPELEMRDYAHKLCRRAFGIGADGLFFLDDAPDGHEADYIWHFYNADGSRAEMCGNGSRCAARLAVELGLAPREHVIGTDAGLVAAEVYPDAHRVKVKLTAPVDEKLGVHTGIDGLPSVHFVNTGVPHAVSFVEDLQALDIMRFGSAVRYNDAFAPKGTNANFAHVVDARTIHLRTYERGVEAETFACGTGACATVHLAHKLQLVGTEVDVITSGGETLTITLADDTCYLTGGAEITFAGAVDLDSVGL